MFGARGRGDDGRAAPALERHHAAMAGTVREGDVAGYRAGNAAFHALISEGAANGYLTQLIASTRERLAPYRGLQLEAPRRLARSYAEHGEIVTAILRGDQSSAAAAMRRHLVVTQETLEHLASAVGEEGRGRAGSRRVGTWREESIQSKRYVNHE